MRKALLTLLSFALLQTLFSQEDSVLKNFKYRIDHYQAITVNVNAAGQYDKTELVPGSFKNSAASGSLGGSYSFIKSTDRILFNVNGSLGASFNTNKANNPTTENKAKSSFSILSLGISNKWFSKKYFTELGATVNTILNTGRSTSTNFPTSATSNDFSQSVGITAGIGKGRLENVTDMQNALWLYKAMKGENKISRDLSPSELNELGRAITKANNTRILDARKKIQYMLETVDQFFREKNLVNPADIRYFSTLNDILFFAFNNLRLSGTEKFIRVTPSFYHLNRDQEQAPSKYENDLTTKMVTVSIGISSYHPVNLVHQNNMGASLVAKYIDHNDNEKFFTTGLPTTVIEMNPILKQASLNLFFQHAIYPNTRTVMSLGINSETGIQDTDNTDSDFFAKVDLTGNISYFISYRTRFTFGLTASYQNNYNDFNPYFSLLPNRFQLLANAGIEINL